MHTTLVTDWLTYRVCSKYFAAIFRRPLRRPTPYAIAYNAYAIVGHDMIRCKADCGETRRSTLNKATIDSGLATARAHVLKSPIWLIWDEAAKRTDGRTLNAGGSGGGDHRGPVSRGTSERSWSGRPTPGRSATFIRDVNNMLSNSTDHATTRPPNGRAGPASLGGRQLDTHVGWRAQRQRTDWRMSGSSY